MTKIADQKLSKKDFSVFISCFPLHEPPVTITLDSHLLFSKQNDPIPNKLIEKIIIPIDQKIDEFTEFVPCFRMEVNKEISCFIYWKAGLLLYEYNLVTFSNKMGLIDKKTIAGTMKQDDLVLNSIAHIDEEFIIHTVMAHGDNSKFSPAESVQLQMEILPDGIISVYSN